MKRVINFFTNAILAYESIVEFTRERNLEMNADHMFQAVICFWGALLFMGITSLLSTIGYFFMPGLFITFGVIFGIASIVFIIMMFVKVVEAFDWN